MTVAGVGSGNGIPKGLDRDVRSNELNDTSTAVTTGVPRGARVRGFQAGGLQD